MYDPAQSKTNSHQQAQGLNPHKFQPEEEPSSGKSKAELKAERRAKQEAQRAAKAAHQTTVKAKPEVKEVKPVSDVATKVIIDFFLCCNQTKPPRCY